MNPVSSQGNNTEALIARDPKVKKAEREKKQLEVNLNKLSDEIRALELIKSKLENLHSKVEDLSKDNSFFSRNVNIGKTEDLVLTAQAENKTLNGAYNVSITKLATETVITGSINVGQKISETNDVSGITLADINARINISVGNEEEAGEKVGKFTINNSIITIKLSDSLQDVFDSIATETGSEVTASYDSSTDQITLSSSSEIILGSPTDTTNFLAACNLFYNGTTSISSGNNLGKSKIYAPSVITSKLNSSISNMDGNGDSSFTINGQSISYNVNSDSIGNIMDRINQSEAKAAIRYHPENDSFSIQNTEPGSFSLSISETSGGILSAMGLTTSSGGVRTIGENATFTINNGPSLTSQTNTFTEISHGVQGLSIHALQTGTDTVTISSNSENPEKKISDFISSYNDLVSTLDNSTKKEVQSDKVYEAPLANSPSARGIAKTLRSIILSSVNTGSSTTQLLDHIGVGFTGMSLNLEVKDSEKLRSAIKSNSASVNRLFTKESETPDSTNITDPEMGLIQRIKIITENAITMTRDEITSKPQGSITRQIEISRDQQKDLATAISKKTKELEGARKKAVADMTKVDMINQNMQTQLAMLSGIGTTL